MELDSKGQQPQRRETEMAKREFKRCRTKADVLADPRVQEWYTNGNGGDWGKDIWVVLKDGFNWAGCGQVHEGNWGEVCDAMENVERGDSE